MSVKIKNREISENNKPYIIAEIGSNHNGSIKLCKKTIESAKRPGNGHPPSDLAEFVGSKALKKIKSDTVISLKDFKNI